MGVTTNGSCLTERVVNKVVAAKPFNVNISVDGHISEIHDYARGINGSLEKITKHLKILLAERKVDSTPKCNPSAHAASCNVSAKNTV